ncbi:MAG: TIGR04255 family protein [Pirellulales bacterium]|nr:TIGR04255 family protein [Pirellulales bacterium]
MGMTLRLKNPPVQEVGLDFQFEPNPEKQPWCQSVAMSFLNRFQETFPICEVYQAEEIRIEKRTKEGIPKELSGSTSLDHVRAHDEDETRWLHLGNDAMTYRLVRRGNDYPGFSALLEESLDKLTLYVEHFQPISVRQASLRYVDVVEIPITPGSGILTEDYFHLGLTLPDDPFGPLAGFAVRYGFPRAGGKDSTQLVFSTEASSRDAVASFRLQWYSICEELDTLEPEVLKIRLGAAHEHLKKCFFASFTPQGLALFEPEEIVST